jgi:Bacterial Ig-like domain (group 3)/FG-GAP-like repeat
MTGKRSLTLKPSILTASILFIAVLTVPSVTAAPAGQSRTGQPSTPDQKPASAAPDSGNSLFLPSVVYSFGPSSVAALSSVTVLDVNGDGKADLLWDGVAANNTGSVGVLLGNGDGTFQGSSGPFDTGGQAAGPVVVADLNNDGKPDLVVAEFAGQASVGVLLGNGDGTFQQAVVYDTGATGVALSAAVGDLNGDGKPDLVVANLKCTTTSFEGCVSVLLGNGDGTFQKALVYDAAGWNSQSIVLADVNGDGKLDLLVTNAGGVAGSVGVMLGKGDGTFQPAVAYASGGDFALNLAVADVNSDGRPDLVVANVYSDTIGVLLGNGDGTFRRAVAYSSGGHGILSMVVKDVNGDGNLDVLAANCGALWGFCPGTNGAVVSVLLGNRNGTFRRAEIYSVGSAPKGIPGEAPQDLTVADVNGDGIPDLLVTRFFSGWLAVLLGNGDGTFQPPLNYDSGSYKEGMVAVADLNGDGRLDLAISGANPEGIPLVGVLLNSGTAVCARKCPSSAALSSSLNPSIYGQTVTWTATVTSSGSSTPTGKVNFMWGVYSIGTASLNASGMATLTRSTLNADTYPLRAVYGGDANNLASTSALLNQVVTQTTSSAALASSPNPSTQGQAVTFTAAIVSPTVTATGPVTFTVGKTVLGTAQLSGGKAKLTISTLAVGANKVTATYHGDSNIAESSASVTQTVQQ